MDTLHKEPFEDLSDYPNNARVTCTDASQEFDVAASMVNSAALIESA